MVPYVIVAESSLPSYTVTVTTLVGSGFAMGELALGLEAYLFRDWTTLTVNKKIIMEMVNLSQSIFFDHSVLQVK